MRKSFLCTGICLLVAVFCYAVFVEPNRITVNDVEINDPVLYREWGDIRIAHLSDLHVVEHGVREIKLLQMLEKIKPDLVVISGDLLQWGKYPDAAIDLVSEIKAPMGVISVLGDSDLSSGRHHCRICHPEGNVHSTRTRPVFLQDNTVLLSVPGSGKSVQVVGLRPEENCDGLDKKINGITDADNPILVLSHFPTCWQKSDPERPVLWLSGDNHGGQIAMPDIIWETFSTKSDPAHKSGLFHGGNHKWLFVTNGIGVTGSFPLRFGVPPEITVLHFSDR